MAPRRAFQALIVVAVAAAFWPALSGQWLNWDDTANFVRNPHFRGLGASNLAWMFTNTLGHYMPLTWLTLGLDYEIWGLNPFGYHLTNVVLHAINALLCFQLLIAFLKRFTGRAEPTLQDLAAAFVGTLVYALHPSRVESVAWVTERRDLVAGLFLIPCVTAYLKAVGEEDGPRRSRWLGLSVGLFALSLLSKTIGMTLPLALLALDAALGRFKPGPDGRRPWRRLALEKLPYAALMLAGVVLTLVTTKEAGSFSSNALTFAQVVTQPPYKLASYAWRALLPLDLAPVYVYRPPKGLFELRFVLSYVFTLGATLALVLARRRAPGALAAWAGFALLLAPVISPIQAGPHATADRYTYLAGLTLGVVAAAWLSGLAPGRARSLALAASAAVAIAFGAAAFAYAGHWRDSERLWTRQIAKDPFVSAYHNRGVYRSELGRLDEALDDFNRALELVPSYSASVANRGKIKMTRGDLDGALADANRAIELAPGIGYNYQNRGEVQERRGRLREAEEDYSRALTLDRTLVDAYVYRAMIRGQSGRLKEAFEDCSIAILIDPFRHDAYMNRAVARGQLGDVDGALNDYAAALRLSPNVPEAWGGRGMCFALKGLWRDAALCFEKALEVGGPRWPHRADTARRLAEARARSR